MNPAMNYLTHEALALRYVLGGGGEIEEILDSLSPSSRNAAEYLLRWQELHPKAMAEDFIAEAKDHSAFASLADFFVSGIALSQQKNSFEQVKYQQHSAEIRRCQALAALQNHKIEEARAWLELEPSAKKSNFSLLEELERIQTTASQEQIQFGSGEGVLLDPHREEFALWLNSCLGARAALEPGRTLLIGGAPGGGKTSLASAFACDAMLQGIPTLLWQMELSRSEQVEHLASQICQIDNKKFTQIAMQPWRYRLKNSSIVQKFAQFEDLLQMPDPDERQLYSAEWIADQMRSLARKSIRQRKEGQYSLPVNGLCIVDYVQLIQSESGSRSNNRHEILERATNLLVKTAADFGLVLILNSQLNKDREENGAKDTSFAGADLVRMAHVAITLVPSKDEQEQNDSIKLILQKHRGTLDGSRSRYDQLLLQFRNRLLISSQLQPQQPISPAEPFFAEPPKKVKKNLSTASHWLLDLED